MLKAAGSAPHDPRDPSPEASCPPIARRPWTWVGLALIVAATVLAHWSATLAVPFLLDDLAAVELLHPEGPLDLDRAWRTMLAVDPELTYHGHFRPVGWASLVLDDLLFGLRPGALRAVALLIHAATALGIVAIGLRLLPPSASGATAALLGGLLFAVWPGAVEPVVWVAHRFTILAALFFVLALLAVLRFVRTGYGAVAVFALVLAGMLSKDSLLAEAWALVPAALVAAPRGARVRRALGTAALVAAAAVVTLALRLVTTGTLLPSFSGDGDVLATMDPDAIVRGLPEVLLGLFAPVVDGPGAWWIRGALLATTLALVAGGLAAHAIRRGLLLGAILLVTLLAAGFPTLLIGPDLDGSRRLYLPAAALSVLLAVCGGGWRTYALVGLFGLELAALRRNQDTYLEAGEQVRRVVAAVEQAAPGPEDLLVTGAPELPATWRGAPLFGGGTHVPLYFRPPLRQERLDVRYVPPEEVAEVAATAVRPIDLLVFGRPDARKPRDLLGLVHWIRLGASLPPAQATGIDVVIPQPGSVWPGPPDATDRGHWLVLGLPWTASDVGVPLRLVIEAGGRRADILFLPSAQPDAASWSQGGEARFGFPIRQIRPLFPVPHLVELEQAAAAAEGIAGRLWVEGATTVTQAFRSAVVPFILGGAPR